MVTQLFKALQNFMNDGIWCQRNFTFYTVLPDGMCGGFDIGLAGLGFDYWDG